MNIRKGRKMSSEMGKHRSRPLRLQSIFCFLGSIKDTGEDITFRRFIDQLPKKGHRDGQLLLLFEPRFLKKQEKKRCHYVFPKVNYHLWDLFFNLEHISIFLNSTSFGSPFFCGVIFQIFCLFCFSNFVQWEHEMLFYWSKYCRATN